MFFESFNTFKDQCISHKNLVKWIFVNGILWTVCWAYVDMTILTSKNTRSIVPMNLTDFDYFYGRNNSDIGCNPEEPFCGFI